MDMALFMRLDVRVTGNDRHIRQKPCGGTQAVMAWITLLFLSFFCFVSMPPAALHAAVLETKYATIIYDDPLILGEFNSSLGMLGLGYSVRDKDLRSINDQARDKVDVIIERVRRVLKMRDTNLKFRMVLLPTAREVGRFSVPDMAAIPVINLFMRREKRLSICHWMI